jgi:hypothetical protein
MAATRPLPVQGHEKIGDVTDLSAEIAVALAKVKKSNPHLRFRI